MRLPSCETSISPTLVVWSLLIGIGSTSGCASAVADVRWQMTARSWSARCNEKKYCPPRTRGTLIRSERMRPERRDLIAARDGRCPSSDWVYLFCASIQARVSGLCWSSSQRYGSTISTPWRVSRTLSVRVGGAATFFAAPLALAAGAAPAIASARPSNHEIVRVDLIEDLLVMHAATRCAERLTPESGIPKAQIRGARGGSGLDSAATAVDGADRQLRVWPMVSRHRSPSRSLAGPVPLFVPEWRNWQ